MKANSTNIEPFFFFFFDLPVLTGTVDYVLKADIYEERQNTEVMQALKKKKKKQYTGVVFPYPMWNICHVRSVDVSFVGSV